MSTTFLRSASPDLLAPPPATLPLAARLRRLATVPLLMLAAAFLLRGMGFLAAVIDTDEGLYIVQAREWLRGGWPLVAVWDMHPIGAPAVYAVALTLFGDGIAAIRLLGILATAATGCAIHGFVRIGGGSRALGIAAGVLYIAHSVVLFGLATNTEILFAPCVAGAMALGLRAAIRATRDGVAPGWAEIGLAGLAIGLAFAIKPVVTPEGCLAFALLTVPALRARVLPLRRALAMAASYAGLAILPTAIFALVYALRGDFAAFLDGSFLAPFRYSMDRLGIGEAMHRVQNAALVLLWPILLAGVALARWGFRPGAHGLLARVSLLWVAVGSLAISGPGFFYPHYFLIWLPPLSVLAALGAWRFARVARPRWTMAFFAALIALVAADAWRGEAEHRLNRGLGLWTTDPVLQVTAEIRRRLQPGDAIFIANYHPVIYALTDARLSTRFVFPAHLTSDFTQVAGIDTDVELRRVLATKPRIVVVDRGWWLQMRDSAQAILEEVLERDFVLEAEVEEERGPVELWRPKTPEGK